MKLLTKFVEGWLWTTAIRPWFACYIKDYRDLSLPEDHEYVTRTRENMFSESSNVQTGREDRLPHIPPTLEPFRQLLRESPWLRGDQPNYADYRALSIFLWTASIATIPPLTEDDPLRDWLDRGLRSVWRPGATPRYAHPVWFEGAAEGDPGALHQGTAARGTREPQHRTRVNACGD